MFYFKRRQGIRAGGGDPSGGGRQAGSAHSRVPSQATLKAQHPERARTRPTVSSSSSSSSQEGARITKFPCRPGRVARLAASTCTAEEGDDKARETPLVAHPEGDRRGTNNPPSQDPSNIQPTAKDNTGIPEQQSGHRISCGRFSSHCVACPRVHPTWAHPHRSTPHVIRPQWPSRTPVPSLEQPQSSRPSLLPLKSNGCASSHASFAASWR